MEIYQHDSATMFRFVPRGELTGEAVKQLQNAWTTAKSILPGKILHIDLSGLTHADSPGVDLLSRMRECGARFAGTPHREPFCSLFDSPAAALPRRSDGLALRILKCAGFTG